MEQLPLNYRTKNPRNLLQQMLQCPTFDLLECKRHYDRPKKLRFAWKATLNVRSSAKEFVGYGKINVKPTFTFSFICIKSFCTPLAKTKRQAIRRASEKAVNELYGIPLEFSRDEADIHPFVHASTCALSAHHSISSKQVDNYLCFI